MPNADPYLGTKTLMREFLDVTMPPGSIWHPKPGGDLDNLLDGIGDNLQTIYDELAELADVRNPNKTSMLDDLEREFGITSDYTLSSAVRIAHLSWKMFTRGTNGSSSDLQAALDVMGFGSGGYGLQVFENDSPQPADPSNFIAGATAEVYCGGSNAYCGYGGTTVCGFAAGGELLANGDYYEIEQPVICCGYPSAYCGYGGTTVCGGTPAAIEYHLVYTFIPAPNPLRRQSWPFIFFIAAGASYDADGNISGLTFGAVPQNQLGALKRLVLAMKPLSTWGVLYVNSN